MKLLPDWKGVLSRAWSMKMIGFAAFIELIQNVVPLVSDYLPWWATVLALGFAAVSRLLQQPEAEDGKQA